MYVTSPYQINFRVYTSNDYLLAVLANSPPVALIYDAQWVLEHGGFGTPTAVNTYEVNNPTPGTGPYMVTGALPNGYQRFTQNPTYWGDRLNSCPDSRQIQFWIRVMSENIIINYKPDEISRYVDLSTGAAQIAAIGSSTLSLVLGNPNQYGVVLAPPWGSIVTPIFFNTQKYPTNITAVRQAIVHAINYSQIISEALFGYGKSSSLQSSLRRRRITTLATLHRISST